MKRDLLQLAPSPSGSPPCIWWSPTHRWRLRGSALERRLLRA